MKSSRPKNRAILVKTSKGRDKKFLSMATSLENGQEISGYTIDHPLQEERRGCSGVDTRKTRVLSRI